MSSVTALEALWRALDDAGAASFFTSWDWISSWLTTLPRNLHPEIITARRNDRIVGAAVGFESSRSRFGVKIPQLLFNASGAAEFDCITVEHNDFAGEAALLPRFARWFARQREHGDELVLPGVADAISVESSELVHSRQMKQGRTNRRLEAIARDGLGTTLSRNTRQQLAKSIRDFEAFGPLAVAEASNIEEAIAYFEGLKALHIASFSRRGKPHAFRYPYFEIFHKALIERAMPQARIQLLKVSAGERLLGYLYNFRYRTRVYAYQSGFSDADGSLRPGYVCHALAIELNARQGMTEYDFLAGENRLKASLGETEYELGWHSLSRPSPIVRLESFARAMRRRTER